MTYRELFLSAKNKKFPNPCNGVPSILFDDGSVMNTLQLLDFFVQVIAETDAGTLTDCPVPPIVMPQAGVYYEACDTPSPLKKIPLLQQNCKQNKLWVLYSKLGNGSGGITNNHPGAAAYNAAYNNTFTYLGKVQSGELHPMLGVLISGWYLYAVWGVDKPVNDGNGHEWFAEEGYLRAALDSVANPDPSGVAEVCEQTTTPICGTVGSVLKINGNNYTMPTDWLSALYELQAVNPNITSWADAGFCELMTAATDTATAAYAELLQERVRFSAYSVNSDIFTSDVVGYGYTNYGYNITSFIKDGVEQLASPISGVWGVGNPVKVPKEAAGLETVPNYLPTNVYEYFGSDRNLPELLNSAGVAGFRFDISAFEDTKDLTQVPGTSPQYGDGVLVDFPKNSTFLIKFEATYDGVVGHTVEIGYDPFMGKINKIDGADVGTFGNEQTVFYLGTSN